MLASLLAAGMPLGAQNLGSEYRLIRVIPVEGRQGVAADSNFYYVSGSTALYKYDKQGRLAAKNERPFEGLPLAANHIGDIDVWDGEIYAGIETFDDGRATAAFTLLGQMSHHGQVIYLTHHRHLCEIARAACPQARVLDLTAL